MAGDQDASKQVRLGEGAAEVRARCWAALEQKVARLPLGDRPVLHATVESTAVREGLANAELRGGTLRRDADQARICREAFETVVGGLVRHWPLMLRSRDADAARTGELSFTT